MMRLIHHSTIIFIIMLHLDFVLLVTLTIQTFFQHLLSLSFFCLQFLAFPLTGVVLKMLKSSKANYQTIFDDDLV